MASNSQDNTNFYHSPWKKLRSRQPQTANESQGNRSARSESTRGTGIFKFLQIHSKQLDIIKTDRNNMLSKSFNLILKRYRDRVYPDFSKPIFKIC